MAYDKKLHFVAGLLSAMPAGYFAAPVYGLTTAMLAGICKELMGWFSYGSFDWRDMVVTWFGGFVGCIVMLLLKR